MRLSQIFSRRKSAAVDFRPDVASGSPYTQLRRLAVYLDQESATADDITDCTDALDMLREFAYRKTFGGTTHEQFLETDAHHPEAIDWLLAVAEVEAEAHKRRNNSEKRNPR